MRARGALLVTVAAAAVGTSVASAGADATKQRVQIDMKLSSKSTFVLMPLQTGALEHDSGTHSCTEEADPRTVLRDGQEAFLWECRALVLTGKRGRLVLRSRFAWVEAGGSYNIATGTWRVVRGTGQYARATGSGRSADVGTPSMRLTRYQGFLTSP